MSTILTTSNPSAATQAATQMQGILGGQAMGAAGGGSASGFEALMAMLMGGASVLNPKAANLFGVNKPSAENEAASVAASFLVAQAVPVQVVAPSIKGQTATGDDANAQAGADGQQPRTPESAQQAAGDIKIEVPLAGSQPQVTVSQAPDAQGTQQQSHIAARIQPSAPVLAEGDIKIPVPFIGIQPQAPVTQASPQQSVQAQITARIQPSSPVLAEGDIKIEIPVVRIQPQVAQGNVADAQAAPQATAHTGALLLAKGGVKIEAVHVTDGKPQISIEQTAPQQPNTQQVQANALAQPALSTVLVKDLQAAIAQAETRQAVATEPKQPATETATNAAGTAPESAQAAAEALPTTAPLTYAEVIARMQGIGGKQQSSGKKDTVLDTLLGKGADKEETSIVTPSAQAVKAAASSDGSTLMGQGGSGSDRGAGQQPSFGQPVPAFVASKLVLNEGARLAEGKAEKASVVPGFDPLSQLGSDAMVRAQVASSAPLNQSRVVQVGDYTFTMVRRGEGSLELTLQPEGLGKLHLEVSLERGVVSAHINAPDQATRDIIERNIQGIMAELQKDGINVGGFSVDVRSNDAGAEQGKNNTGRKGNGAGGAVSSAAPVTADSGISADADRLLSVYA